MEYEGMLAKKGEQEKLGMYGAAGFIAEPKLDGIRFLLTIGRDKTTLVSRGGLDDAEKYPFLDSCSWTKVLDGTVLDGEMVVLKNDDSPLWECSLPGIQSINGSDTDRARRLCHQKHVYFVVFDVLRYDGADVTGNDWLTRRRMLERKIFNPATAILAPEVVLIEPVNEDPEALWKKIVPPAEGIMLKHKFGIYEPGCRSSLWLKIKNTEETECEIFGWKAGKGKFTGLVGSVLVKGVDSGEKFRGKFGALTDEERAAFSDAEGRLRQEWYGRRVIVKYYPGGVRNLRHCQLSRILEK